MNKIRDYLTKEGWKEDWSQTKKDIAGLVEPIKSKFEKGQRIFYEGKFREEGCITEEGNPGSLILPGKVLGWNPFSRKYAIEIRVPKTEKRITLNARAGEIFSQADMDNLIGYI